MKYIIEINTKPPTLSDLFHAFIKSKPLTLCQDCKKWKTPHCKKVVHDGETYTMCQCPVLVHTDPDDYCKDGEAK